LSFFPEDGKPNAIAFVKKSHKLCVDAGLRTAAITASNLLWALENNKEHTRKRHAELTEELSHRVVDELSCEFFLQLDLAEADCYENWQKGWEVILADFPDITRDVEEMNKCWALSRYTAAMFHALHVAEWGAILLGGNIGVTDPKRGWGPTERKLREIVKAGHSALPSASKVTYEFLGQMHREIESMMLAWRHKVDHAANTLAILPNTDFTPDVAEHVIGAVRIFMMRLREGLAP
jgi:hypothetical protein